MQFFFKSTQKMWGWKLISMYGAVFCFTICLTLNGVLDYNKGGILMLATFWSVWYHLNSEMTCLHYKEKGKSLWPASYLFGVNKQKNSDFFKDNLTTQIHTAELT